MGDTNDELNRPTRDAHMRIYDIEFDIDSFIDEMEELQRARRQRYPEPQIHRPSDYRIPATETPSERETE